jgi:cysteinyl-tRNA synthetase
MAKELKTTNDKNLKENFAAALDFFGLFSTNNFFCKKDLQGNKNFDINSQIELRLKFKQEKNFSKADEIRNSLLSQGIILEDISKDKTIWKKS